MIGKIYIIKNDIMKNIIKIGLTTDNLENILNEANNIENKWKPPSPYYIIYAKEVNDSKIKFKNLIKLLNKYQNENKLENHFYKVDLDDILIFLDLMDGKEITIKEENEQHENEQHESEQHENEQHESEQHESEQHENEHYENEQHENEQQEILIEEKQKKKKKREK